MTKFLTILILFAGIWNAQSLIIQNKIIGWAMKQSLEECVDFCLLYQPCIAWTFVSNENFKGRGTCLMYDMTGPTIANDCCESGIVEKEPAGQNLPNTDDMEVYPMPRVLFYGPIASSPSSHLEFPEYIDSVCPISVSFWVWPFSLSPHKKASQPTTIFRTKQIIYDDEDGIAGLDIKIDIESSRRQQNISQHLSFNIRNGQKYISIVSQESIVFNQWTHITISLGENFMSVYVNGRNQGLIQFDWPNPPSGEACYEPDMISPFVDMMLKSGTGDWSSLFGTQKPNTMLLFGKQHRLSGYDILRDEVFRGFMQHAVVVHGVALHDTQIIELMETMKPKPISRLLLQHIGIPLYEGVCLLHQGGQKLIAFDELVGLHSHRIDVCPSTWQSAAEVDHATGNSRIRLEADIPGYTSIYKSATCAVGEDEACQLKDDDDENDYMRDVIASQEQFDDISESVNELVNISSRLVEVADLLMSTSPLRNPWLTIFANRDNIVRNPIVNIVIPDHTKTGGSFVDLHVVWELLSSSFDYCSSIVRSLSRFMLKILPDDVKSVIRDVVPSFYSFAYRDDYIQTVEVAGDEIDDSSGELSELERSMSMSQYYYFAQMLLPTFIEMDSELSSRYQVKLHDLFVSHNSMCNDGMGEKSVSIPQLVKLWVDGSNGNVSFNLFDAATKSNANSLDVCQVAINQAMLYQSITECSRDVAQSLLGLSVLLNDLTRLLRIVNGKVSDKIFSSKYYVPPKESGKSLALLGAQAMFGSTDFDRWMFLHESSGMVLSDSKQIWEIEFLSLDLYKRKDAETIFDIGISADWLFGTPLVRLDNSNSANVSLPLQFSPSECEVAASYFIASAQYCAVFMMEDGSGIFPMDYMRLEDGDFEGQSGNDDDLFQFHKEQADNGDSNSQMWMGKHLFWGRGGIAPDQPQAVEYFNQAAEQGNAEGLYNMGAMHANGHGGVQQDWNVAMSYFQRSADMDFIPAMNGLGSAYFSGNGGAEKNYTKAFEYFKRAADDASADGHFNVANLYRHGLGVETDVPKAVQHYATAVSMLHYSAMQELSTALFYHDSWLSHYGRSRVQAKTLFEPEDDSTMNIFLTDEDYVEIKFLSDSIYIPYRRDCLAAMQIAKALSEIGPWSNGNRVGLTSFLSSRGDKSLDAYDTVANLGIDTAISNSMYLQTNLAPEICSDDVFSLNWEENLVLNQIESFFRLLGRYFVNCLRQFEKKELYRALPSLASKFLRFFDQDSGIISCQQIMNEANLHNNLRLASFTKLANLAEMARYYKNGNANLSKRLVEHGSYLGQAESSFQLGQSYQISNYTLSNEHFKTSLQQNYKGRYATNLMISKSYLQNQFLSDALESLSSVKHLAIVFLVFMLGLVVSMRLVKA